MEGCFMFQWWGGGLFCRLRGDSFLNGGVHPMGGASVLMGVFSKKNVGWGGTPHAPQLWETLPSAWCRVKGKLEVSKNNK